MQYDEYKNKENTKGIAYELVKKDIELTTIRQREVEVQIERRELDTRQKLEEAYDLIDNQMKKLRHEFEQDTGADEKLVEYFREDDPKIDLKV